MLLIARWPGRATRRRRMWECGKEEDTVPRDPKALTVHKRRSGLDCFCAVLFKRRKKLRVAFDYVIASDFPGHR